jgi:hybrid polyketide synthase / nonribosomal peptide synthetase ACE1
MVLEDTSFFEMSFETMQKVLRPKVQGAIYLNELFQDESLDFFIFFSSVAAVVGNRGQSAYSTANMFMTSLAYQRRQKGLAASILHIGAVVGVGYVTRELSETTFLAVRKAGFMWMSERGFHLCLAEAILASQPESGRNPEIVTGLNMITSQDKEPSPWTKFPRFQHCVHESGGKEVKTNQRTATISAKVQLSEASTEEEVFEIVKGESQ